MRIKASLNPDSRRVKVHLCDNEDNAMVWTELTIKEARALYNLLGLLIAKDELAQSK